MSQKAAAYEHPVIHGLSAKIIQQLETRCVACAVQPIKYLKRSVKFALGESKDLPETCGLDDEAQHFGAINLTFDLMAIEVTSNEGEWGDYDCVFLYKRISDNKVEVFSFARKRDTHGWGVMECPVTITAEIDQPHGKSATGDVENGRELFGLADCAILILRSLNTLLNCNNVATETVAAPANESGVKLGRRKKKLLQFEYRILTIKGRNVGGHGSGANHQSARRLHLRRGHNMGDVLHGWKRQQGAH